MHKTFSEPTVDWFRDSFDGPTLVQKLGWPAVASGGHTLLLAPTGSGKTLAAFLVGIDRTLRLPSDAEPGVRVLYVSPLKALVYDFERNLRAPLRGILERAGGKARQVSVDVRTGDTPQNARRRQLRRPADILVTTPESLYLMLTSAARETLRTVHTVIIDEIHALVPTKRGVHLSMSLERLQALCERPPQRVGLSATVRPVQGVANFLGGVDREVQIVDAANEPRMDLLIEVPVEDMTQPVVLGADGPRKAVSLWPAIYPRLLELIGQHRTTLIFTNSRLLCERLCQKLNELAEDEVAMAHHGSVSHARRAVVEEALKGGQIPCIVATSSLELGIDMGAIDLVIMVESPGSSARGLQRIGRAGHQVGVTSVGRIFPKYQGDLLEAAVVGQRMRLGLLEPLAAPKNCLDV
ncbi:MAG: ATP-dependent Lhr-like helicase, partial [Kiritimatiellia bacterium]